MTTRITNVWNIQFQAEADTLEEVLKTLEPIADSIQPPFSVTLAPGHDVWTDIANDA